MKSGLVPLRRVSYGAAPEKAPCNTRHRRCGSRWDDEAARNVRVIRARAREGLWSDAVVRIVDPDGMGRGEFW